MIRLLITVNEDEVLFPIVCNTWSLAVAILNIFTNEDWPDADVRRIRVKVEDYPPRVVIEPSEWHAASEEQAEGRFKRNAN